jgi:peptidoglycan/LPS O-acetylase OafA/YrhL
VTATGPPLGRFEASPMTTVDPVVPGPTGTRSRVRLETLTGLRFVAAFAVFWAHGAQVIRRAEITDVDVTHLGNAAGAMGVTFFFILSGFVLTWSRSYQMGVGPFYRRRFARIFPVFWAVMAVVLVLQWRRGAVAGFSETLAAVLLVQSWIPNDAYYFAVLGVAWTLSCEVFFYAAAPWVIPTLRQLTTTYRGALIGLLFALSAALAIIFPFDDVTEFNAWLGYVFPPIRMIEFVLGVLLAFEVMDGRWRRIGLGWASALASAGFLIGLAAPLAWTNSVIVTLPFMVLIAASAYTDNQGSSSLLAVKPLVLLGAWSYCFYLVHYQVILEIETRLSTTGNVALVAAILAAALVAAIATSWLFYTLVERPAERRIRNGRRLNQCDSAVRVRRAHGVTNLRCGTSVGWFSTPRAP